MRHTPFQRLAEPNHDNAERADICMRAADNYYRLDDRELAVAFLQAGATFALAAATDKLRKAHGEAQERVRSALVNLGPV